MSNIHKEGLDESKEVDISDEISLKNFIYRIKEYYQEVKERWLVLLLLGAFFIAILGYQWMTTPEVYPAKMTFMVNEESGGGGGGVGGLLNQFGFGGGGGGSYNLTKVIELSKSREIVKQALFLRDSTQENPDFLVNKLITVYGLREAWADNPDLADFSFKHDDFDRFTREENSIMKSLHGLVVGGEDGGGITKLEVNAETSIFKMVVNGREEALSIQLLNGIYNALSSFYISETIEKPKNTYENLKARTDSVRAAIVALEYQLAKDYDTNLGLLTRRAQLNRNRLEREVRAAGMEYAKLLENLGVSEFTLENATPVFQVIDAAIEPIDPVKEPFWKPIVFGAVIGIVLGIILILFLKIYRDAMREENL